MTLRVLDLYCGAGLVADGLIAAGCEVVGVDIKPQPRYPGPFIRANALHIDSRFVATFDVVWASPPCLRDTAMKHAPGAKGDAHPDLITPTREMLRCFDLPYVIENVAGAELVRPVLLCGSMFGLGSTVSDTRYHLQRHRYFETNWTLRQPRHTNCDRAKPVVGVYGGHARVRAKSAGGRGTADKWPNGHVPVMTEAMGLDPARGYTATEISQGIPPIYAQTVIGALIETKRSPCFRLDNKSGFT